MAPRNLPNPQWPEIDYHNDNQNLPMDIPQAMVTKVRNYATVDTNVLLNGINNMTELEENIISSINGCDINNINQIINIFHKIEIWGGPAAGRTYTCGGGFSNNIDLNSYVDLIKTCVSIIDHSINSLENIFEKTNNCISKCHYFGVSFITKHVYYWTHKSLHENALPIFDSKLSNGLYHCNPNIKQVVYYWQDMIEKARRENVSTKSLERTLFLCF